MNTVEAVVHRQPEDLSLPNSRREVMLKSSRKLFLVIALTSTVGWIYFLAKAAMFVGAAAF
jgi:hypothetical protein